jgi:hypothetical protein
VIARSARGGTPVPTWRSPEEESSDSRAARWASRRSARPTNPPSSSRAISSWVPPDPTRRYPRVAAPCLPHNSAISELMMRAKSVISRPSFQPLTWSSGERDGPGLIGAVAPLGRCLPATRARPSGPSPAYRQVTTHHHGRRRKPCSPIAARNETPLPTGTANASLKSGLAARRNRAPAMGRTSLLQPPSHAAIGRRERALSSALMPGRPTRGRRSQTSTGATLLPSQPNTRVPSDRALGYAGSALALSRASASGARAPAAENLHQ